MIKRKFNLAYCRDVSRPFRLALSVLLAALAFGTLSCVASATELPARPTVTRALDFIKEYPSRVPLGTNVVFERRNPESDKSLIYSGLQVRIFKIRIGEKRPTAIAEIDGCEVYMTTVVTLRPTASGELRFTKLNDAWINITSSGNSTKETQWFFVFEKSGLKNSQFRIKTSDAQSYFDTGFSVLVYSDDPIPTDSIRQAYEERRGRAQDLYRELDDNNSAVPCYSYKRLSTKLDESLRSIAYGEIARCGRTRTRFDFS
jgi:hypothetical protein